MVWAAAGNLPEQNKNNKCVNRPPGTAVKKYAGTYDLPCTTVVRAEEALRRFTYLSKWLCIPCITYRTCFILAGIDEASLLQAVDTAVTMNQEGDYGIPVPDYVEENVSTKVVKIIQSYTGVVNKMVWRKLSRPAKSENYVSH